MCIKNIRYILLIKTETFYKVVRMEREGGICFRCILLQKKKIQWFYYTEEK